QSRVSRMLYEDLVKGDIDEAGPIIHDGPEIVERSTVTPAGGADLQSVENGLHADRHVVGPDEKVVVTHQQNPSRSHRPPANLSRLPLQEVHPETWTSIHAILQKVSVVGRYHRQVDIELAATHERLGNVRGRGVEES